MKMFMESAEGKNIYKYCEFAVPVEDGRGFNELTVLGIYKQYEENEAPNPLPEGTIRTYADQFDPEKCRPVYMVPTKE